MAAPQQVAGADQQQSQQDQQPWHAAFPAPAATAPLLARAEALPLVSARSPSLLLVDVRRTDYEGGSVRGSLNLPAQSFYQTRGALLDLVERTWGGGEEEGRGVEVVAFYCGSSSGRGPRCAGWFADLLAERGEEARIRAMTLEGGIKGWVKAGGEYVELVQDYDAEYWKQF